MKQFFILLATLFFNTMVMAQPGPPEPFPIDRSFKPTLEFLQKTWEGSYWGVVPPERQRYHICRTLQLKADMTFTNKITIATDEESKATVLLQEKGKYTYDGAGTLSYDVVSDSTVDMKAWMADGTETYTVHNYADGDEQNYIEQASFTYADGGQGDDSRLWVAFDQKFMSDQNQNMKAVYTMKAVKEEGTGISDITAGRTHEGRAYDLLGRSHHSTLNPERSPLNSHPSSLGARIVIVDGKKILKH